jgi:thymidylate synthase
MKVITVRNVHEALPEGLRYLSQEGEVSESRNGPVIVSPRPVTTAYMSPRERVMFWPQRDANPFFHFFESLWMLAGRNDVEWIANILPSFANYSDDGKSFHGAYGHRWRNHFGVDQMVSIMQRLREAPQERRCVMTMWDPAVDFGMDGKDFPCNTHIYFTRDPTIGNLDMTVCNRSNDVIWGTYGANAVHMSVLQEVMAAGIGCGVGRYYQMSNNYHAYGDIYEKMLPLADEAHNPYRAAHNPYMDPMIRPYKIVTQPIGDWLTELDMFMDDPDSIGFIDPFFRRVAVPMWKAFEAYRDKSDSRRFIKAKDHMSQVCATDWSIACTQWLDRRHQAAINKDKT